jgi:Fe-S-cluster containining protein
MNRSDVYFECQGSGNCCVSRGSYGYVYLSKKDIKKLSDYTNLRIKDFIKLYCDNTNGFTHFKEKNKNGDCQFLVKKRCSIYEARPTQCRTWPFWKENMATKVWNKEISKFCPGIGMGNLISIKEIKRKLKDDYNNELSMLEEINKN